MMTGVTAGDGGAPSRTDFLPVRVFFCSSGITNDEMQSEQSV